MVEYHGQYQKNHRGRYIPDDYENEYRKDRRWTKPTHIQNFQSEGYELIKIVKGMGEAKKLKIKLIETAMYRGIALVRDKLDVSVLARPKACLDGNLED